MARINFPALFGNIMQFNLTQLLNVIAEQEVEKEQLNTLVNQIKEGAVNVSQLEINKQTGEIRVSVPAPEEGAKSLVDASMDALLSELSKRHLAEITAPDEEAPEEFMDRPEMVEEMEYHEFEDPAENVNFAKPETEAPSLSIEI